MYIDSFGDKILELKDYKIGDEVKWCKERDYHVKGVKNTPLHLCFANSLIVTKIGRTRIGVSHINDNKIYMIDPYIINKYER